MTYSIIARDPATGHIGIAVASRFFAVGAAVPYVRANCAVATQAFVNPMWGVEGIERLQSGEAAASVAADLKARDGGQRIRQAHMLDTAGRFAAHTGADCVDWAGHLIGEDASVAGNMLTGRDVIAATLAMFEQTAGLDFAERLLRAMEAGEHAGGDKRGRQSAALVIHRGQDYPWIDIRADDHEDPLAELRRLMLVADERFLHVAKAMATRTNFSGVTDRAPVDAAIAAAEKARAKKGLQSVSKATPLT